MRHGCSGDRKLATKVAARGFVATCDVTQNLYRGAQPERGGLESLAKMGINTVIDLRLTGANKEGADAKKLGMDFVALPWHCLFPKDDPFARFLRYVREHPDKKIFVHC